MKLSIFLVLFLTQVFLVRSEDEATTTASTATTTTATDDEEVTVEEVGSEDGTEKTPEGTEQSTEGTEKPAGGTEQSAAGTEKTTVETEEITEKPIHPSEVIQFINLLDSFWPFAGLSFFPPLPTDLGTEVEVDERSTTCSSHCDLVNNRCREVCVHCDNGHCKKTIRQF